MDKFKAALDSLKKIASAKDEQEMFRLFSENKENFDTVQQRWFGHSRDTETVQVENEDYLQNIVRYVDIAISMYSKAIPHKSLNKVILMFTKNWTDGTEPYIYIEFDSTSLTVAIDDLWQSDIQLERSMEQECVNLSGIVWDEYRGIIDDEQLKYDAEEICTVLKQKYPSTDISFLIKEALLKQNKSCRQYEYGFCPYWRGG